MSTSENLKSLGATIFGITFVGAIAVLGIAVLFGAAELSVWALEWTSSIFGIAILLCALVFAPLSIIPATRGFAGNGLYLASYLFGVILWILSMAFVYLEWGLFPVILGLLLGGIGVVPIAILATVVEGQWGVLGNIAILITLTFGLRILGYWLIEKAAERAIMKAAADTERDRPEFTLRQD